MGVPRPYGVGPYGVGPYSRYRGGVAEVAAATGIRFGADGGSYNYRAPIGGTTGLVFTLAAVPALTLTVQGETSISFDTWARANTVIGRHAQADLVFDAAAIPGLTWTLDAGCETGTWADAPDCVTGTWTPIADCETGTWTGQRP